MFSYKNLAFEWKAILRDGSHYLRTELSVSTSKNTSFKSLTPMIYTVNNKKGDTEPKIVGNTRGPVIASNHIFAGLETPLAFNEIKSVSSKDFTLKAWTPSNFKSNTTSIPQSILDFGFNDTEILVSQGHVIISKESYLSFTFAYQSGNCRLNIVGIDLLKDSKIVASDYHIGYTGNLNSKNIYDLKQVKEGTYTLRYFVESKTEPINSSGNISIFGNSIKPYNGQTILPATTNIYGKWSRNTILTASNTWQVGTVIGLIANGQTRRSFLAYHEREKAMSWRSFIMYNCWYELSITCENNTDPLKRLTEAKCIPIIHEWKNNLIDKYGETIDAFISLFVTFMVKVPML